MNDAPRPPTVLVAHPSGELYGSDRVLLEAVAALVRDGFEVVVTLPVGGTLVHALQGRGARIEQCPSPVLRKSLFTPRGILSFLTAAFRGFFGGWAMISRTAPDLLFVNTLTIPLWVILARFRGVKVICHVHEAESAAPRWQRLALAASLMLAHRIIANSAFSSEVLIEALPSLRRRLHVVYNGVAGPVNPQPARVQMNALLAVVYVGRLSPRKGPDLIVEAIGELERRGIPASLDLYGDVFPGYEWYEEELRESVSRLHLEDVIRFHGFVDPVWPGIASGDVCVVPSRVDEPFGNTAVEAVLSCRPVIASATSGLIEATGGYLSAQSVEPGNVMKLADALQRVFTDWPFWRDAAERDMHVAAERHATDVFGSQIVKHVRDVSERTSARLNVD